MPEKPTLPKLPQDLGVSKRNVEPYVGPRPFRRDIEDQIRFFGRDEKADETVSLISAHKLVLVYAQSGAGKTSIFNAQVIPQLERLGFEVLPMARVQVTASNLISLKDDGNSILNNNSSLPQIENIYIFNAMQSLKPDMNPKEIATKSLREFLSDYFPNAIDDNGEVLPQVLVFDQFEELFNPPAKKWKEQREGFFNQIAQALNSNSSLRIVFVIREDFLAELDSFKSSLPEKLRPRFRLERLREEAAILAIKGPLEKTADIFRDRKRNDIEDEIRKLVKDLTKIQVEDPFGGTYQMEGEFVEPIHLQVVCRRWWREQIKSSPHNVMAGIDSSIHFEDVDKALEEFFENAVYDAAHETNTTEKEIRKWCEYKLITSSGTRSIIHRSTNDTEGMSNRVVDILANKYLIRPEARSGGIWYELTHDRLIKPIENSNARWKEKERKKRSRRNKLIMIPAGVAAAVAIILIVLFVSHPFLLGTCLESIANTWQHPIDLVVKPNPGSVYLYLSYLFEILPIAR